MSAMVDLAMQSFAESRTGSADLAYHTCAPATRVVDKALR
jgi:hypothetical protein